MALKTAICFLDAQHRASRSFFQKTALIELLKPHFDQIEFVFLLAHSADEIYLSPGDQRIVFGNLGSLHQFIEEIKNRSRQADKIFVIENDVLPDPSYCAAVSVCQDSNVLLPEQVLVLRNDKHIYRYQQLDNSDSLDWRCPFFLCLGFSPQMLPEHFDEARKFVAHSLRESLFQIFLHLKIKVQVSPDTTAFAQEQCASFGDVSSPSSELSFFSKARTPCPVFETAAGHMEKVKISHQRTQILESKALQEKSCQHASLDIRWLRLPGSQPQFFSISAPHQPEIDLYRKYCSLLQNSDYVLVLHQLRRGGAEKEAVLHLKAYCDLYPNRKVSLILTWPVEPDLEWQLPPQVQICEFGRETSRLLSQPEQIYLLYRILDQIEPQIIHVKCSYQGWQALVKYGRQLSLKSRLWVSLYCIDYQRQGASTSFAFQELLAVAPYLECLLADNQKLLDDLKKTVVVQNTHKIFYPVEEPSMLWAQPLSEQRRLRVLWCSRLSFQKDINTLVRTALLMPKIEFHVFGELSENTDHAQTLARFPNIKMWGIFDGIDDISLGDYDVFLYTSFWDGLPNILLEVGVRGMPIISPKVGGITEILNAENSYLYDGLRELVTILEGWSKQQPDGKKRGLRLRKDITDCHGWVQFTRKCRELYGQ